ncbi:MAG: VCBS repeat-containing protein [Opitutaceae bacterium]|nr:VCBS repeat-containing protein [Opitutaceae bacterium]
MKHPLQLLLALALATMAVAQTALIRPSPRALSTTQRPSDTAFWRIDNFGFTSLLYDEKHNGWRYPNYEDVNAPGYFKPDMHNVAVGDFNGDGAKDMAISWAIFPHVIAHQTDLTITVLLNDGNGRLVPRPDIWAGPAPKRKYLVYRTHVADFNGDGRDDFVVAPQGLIERTAPGVFTNTYEPVLLVLSRPDGKLEDASARIQGQENGAPIPGIQFSHDMSVGDIDGDGDADFYTAKFAFLNDGRGNFTPTTTQLPLQARPPETYVMSSAIGDLNDDGVGDLVVCPAKTAVSLPLAYVLLSKNGGRSLSDRQVVALPDTIFGAISCRQNEVAVVDVTGDGRLDIVFGLTRDRPYYQGRAIQIFVNKGNGVFADETATRLVDPRKDYVVNNSVGIGEGSLHFVDVNRDGFIDIVDSNGPEDGTGINANSMPGSTVFLNRGNGTFSHLPRTARPWVQRWQIRGFEGYRQYAEGPMDQAYPIDLDGTGNIEFVTFVRTPLSGWPQVEPHEMSFYILRGTTERYEPVTLDSTLSNLSVRSSAGTGDKSLIVGFVVAGGAREVLVRGIGPTLAAFGVPGTLADPTLTLNGGPAIVRNDNWDTSTATPAVFSSVGAFPLVGGTKDAALLASIDGARSAQVGTTDDGSGIALVELYAMPTGAGRLINVSARTEVGTGGAILIAGFNVSGTTPRRLLLRAVGPTLGVFGVGGTLADPTLVVKNAAGIEVAANDNWSTANNAADIAATAARVGAFALGNGSKDAVVLATLPPGAYTASILGVNDTTGVALVEVYEVP